MADLTRDELLAIIRSLPSADAPETSDEVASRVSTGIAAAAAKRRKREADVPKLSPRFDPTFNWGHVAMVLSVVGGFTIAYTNYVAESNAMRASIRALEVLSSKYVPLIEASNKLNDVQDERIQNLSVAVADLRRVSNETAGDARRRDGEIMGILGTLREDMAQVKAKLSIERR